MKPDAVERHIGVGRDPPRPRIAVEPALVIVLVTRLSLGLAALAVVLAGCTQYHPEPLSAVADAAAFDARTLDDARLQSFISLELSDGPAPEHDDPPWDLTRLTLAALFYHPDIDVARAKLGNSEAGVRTARQYPNPSLTLGATYNATTLQPSPWTVGPTINFLLETFGKRRYRSARARHLVEAARANLATAAWQVHGRVRTALLGLWAAQQRKTLLERRLKLQEQLVTLLENRFKAGEAPALDVTRERVNRNQIRLAIRDAERQAVDARARLATAVGVPLHAFDGARLSFDAFEQPEPPSDIDMAAGDLRRRALVGRSDVQALLAEYAAAQSALQLEIARQYPNITLGPGYTYDQGDNKYGLSLSIDLPVFNQNQGPIAEADARRHEIAARFTALQAQIIGAADAAVESYRSVSRSVAVADALVADEQRREREVARSFRAGAVDRPTLVTAELELAAIRLSRLDAVVQQRQALGALEDALQHPLFEPEARILVPQVNPRVPSEPSS